MKYFFSVLWVLTIFGCQVQEQEQVKKLEQVQAPDNDFAAVERVVYDFFASINTLNYQSLNDHITDDFTLFYDGEILGSEDLIELVQAHEKKAKKNYEIEVSTTKINGNFAWMTWRNTAGIKMDAASDSSEWLESAVFKREEGLWKMEFYHSTPAKASGYIN